MQKPSITIEQAYNRASVSPKEFAELSGLSMPSVYRYLESQEIPSTRLSGRILISTNVLKKIIGGDLI